MRNPFKKVDKRFYELDIPEGFETRGKIGVKKLVPGDVVSGKIVAIEEVESGKYKTASNHYTLNTEKGMVKVNPGKGFDTSYAAECKLGETVYIGFKGKSRGTDGVWYKRWAFGVHIEGPKVSDKQLGLEE